MYNNKLNDEYATIPYILVLILEAKHYAMYMLLNIGVYKSVQKNLSKKIIRYITLHNLHYNIMFFFKLKCFNFQFKFQLGRNEIRVCTYSY